ncbi:MAG TPA: type II secretion system protein GspC [Kofleriaceae bacterium]|nr:type II secretion system protein GspC [Kofleriaceae bacterium]
MMILLHALHRIVAGLLHRTYVIALVTLAVCGVFTARAIDAMSADDPLPAPRAPVARPAPKRAQVVALDPQIIVDRNMFCSSCGPTPPTSASYDGLPAVLIATSVAPDATRSHATVRVVSTEVQGSWTIDQTIPGVGRITRIGGGSIDVVDTGGHTKTLTLREPVAAGSTTPGAATPGSGPAAPASAFADRIKKLSETSYEVDRSVVRELVANAGQGAGVRAIPLLDHGEVTGIRLTGVKATSVAAAVGLRNADVLTAIDGTPIKTAQQLLDLYSKLDQLDAVELQGTRGGKPLAISLRLR